MNIVICDDEALFSSEINAMVKVWAKAHDREATVSTFVFSSPEDLLEQWENGLKIDLLFMDIEFTGEENGLYYTKRLFEKDPYIPIVFITNYAQYAVEGYEVNAIRFITKPASQEKISECLEICYQRWVDQYKEFFVFDGKSATVRIPVKEIIYLEVRGHYSIVYHEHGTEKLRLTIEDAMARLPERSFIRCHRSYIVNMMHIRKYQDGEIILSNRHPVPVGRNYFAAFLSAFRNFCLGERKQ